MFRLIRAAMPGNWVFRIELLQLRVFLEQPAGQDIEVQV